MMKKFNLAALILGFIICFGTIVNASNSKNADEASDILKMLNIITEEEFENAGDKAVTRAEFSVYAAKAFGFSPINDKIYFKDVLDSHWANGYISALVEVGSVSKAPDGFFNPDSPVTKEQAYKIMLAGMGYGNLTQNATLSEYMTVAQNAGINITTKSLSSLTITEAAEIIYNSMGIGIANVPAGGKITIDDDNSLLKRFNISKEEGIITAVYGATIDADIRVINEKEAYIGEELYTVGDGVYVKEHLGREVWFLYKEISGERTLIHIIDDNDENLKINSNMVDSVDKELGKVTYYKEGDKTKTITIYEDAKVILNGQVFYGDVFSELQKFADDEKNGYIEFISSGNGKYDIINVKSYKTVIAKQFDTTKEIYIDYYDHSNNINIEDYKAVEYINETGIKSGAPGVFPAVLEVAEAPDKSYAEIIVCTGNVVGKAEAIADDEVLINGTQYKVWDGVIKDILVGTTINAKLDMHGRIVYSKTEAQDALKVGYLIKAHYNGSDSDSNAVFKLFTGESVEKAELSDRVVLDEKTYKMSQDAREFFLSFPDILNVGETAVNLKPQIIRYSLDANGKINKIDSMNVSENEDRDNSLTRGHDGSYALRYNSIIKRFGLDVLYNTTRSTVFTVPIVDTNGEIEVNGVMTEPTDDMYSKGSTFEMDYEYKISNYNFNPDNPYEDIIVLSLESSQKVSQTFMFDSFEQRLIDDDVCKVMICFTNGGKTELVIDSSCEGKIPALNRGDIIKVYKNANKKTVVSVEKMFDAKTKTFLNDGKNNYWFDGTFDALGGSNYRNPSWQLSKAYVYDVNSTVVSSCYEQSYLKEGKVSEKISLSGLTAIIYDTERADRDEIYVGSVSDIDTYKNCGYDCSVILVSSNGASFKNVYIYK